MRRASRSIRPSAVVALVLLTGALLVLPACGDSERAGHRAAAGKIDEAMAQAARALPGGNVPPEPEEAAAAAAELRRIAQGLASIQGAAPGQRSAALMLASSLSRQAAAIELSLAGEVVRAQRAQRIAIDRTAAAATSLESLAAPLERVDFASARTILKGQRDQAESQLRQLQSEIKALEGAMAQVERQIDAAEDEANKLELDANQLRLDARSMRPRQALPYIEQASALQRRNATVRGAIGRHQSERSAIEPQLAGARALGSGGTAVLSATDDAIRQLEALSETARDAAGRARRRAGETRVAGKTRLDAVSAEMNEALEPRFQSAIESLERGATLASQAATGVDPRGADSARLAQASAQMSLARTHVERAAAFDDHAALLRRLDRAGGWGPSSQLEAAVAAAEASRTESIERAKEQYTAAIEALGMLRTPANVNSPEIAGMRTSAEQALQELARPGSTAGAGATADGGSGGAAGSGGAGRGGAGGGAESPEALIALLASGNDPDFDPRRRTAVLHSKQPQLLAALGGIVIAVEPVRAAMIRTFGHSAELSGGSGAVMSILVDAKLVSQDAESAVIEIPDPRTPGATVQAPLVKIDGRWYLDFDAVVDSMAPGQSAMLASTVPMLTAMTKSMAAAANSVAARIDAGEFSTPEEAAAAFQVEVAKAAQSMMGGAAPPPPPPPGR